MRSGILAEMVESSFNRLSHATGGVNGCKQIGDIVITDMSDLEGEADL